MAIEMIGRRFERLLVIAEAGRSNAGQPMWLSRCDCGAEVKATGGDIRSGKVKSCGCLRREMLIQRATSHGATVGGQSPEYATWGRMVYRCGDGSPDAHLYAHRGIRVCARWNKGDGKRSGFECFLADMGKRPSAGHSIDRIDVNGNYEPSNCRWATSFEQANNKRSNRWVTYQGRRMTAMEAWAQAGRIVPVGSFYSRLKRGWPTEAAAETPRIPVEGRRRPGTRLWAT